MTQDVINELERLKTVLGKAPESEDIVNEVLTNIESPLRSEFDLDPERCVRRDLVHQASSLLYRWRVVVQVEPNRNVFLPATKIVTSEGQSRRVHFDEYSRNETMIDKIISDTAKEIIAKVDRLRTFREALDVEQLDALLGIEHAVRRLIAAHKRDDAA